jgi:hypothetical protein
MKQLATIVLVLFCFFQTNANNATYEQRRLAYVDSALASNMGSLIILQSYKGVPVDSVLLTNKLNLIAAKETSDFDIIELVRILFFGNGAYDAKILPVINAVPYWINNYDTVRNYWSENHMIMWMSCDWLLHEKYNRPIDANLRNRLVHYLQLKIQYGYYEFYSPVYAPYSLSGILNLADFAQDPQIKSLARQAAQYLLTDMLRLTNDKGVYFPVAGRSYPGKYESAYGQNHSNLIYLLTGMGEPPYGASSAGAFLSSSTLSVDTVIASWQPDLDTLYSFGHSLDIGFVLNSAMSPVDKTVFQWSSGAYFHPAVVSETVQLLVDSNMWNHVDFELLKPLAAIITPQSAPALSEALGYISQSSVISGQSINIFKHHSVTLSSVPDFWKGKVGFQQHTCMANVGTTAVYTGSGEVFQDWGDRNPNNANVHLPQVKQKKNVALLMYRPEPVTELTGVTFQNRDVALHFKAQDFDEVRNDSLWILGRQGSGYVAVRRNCLDTIAGNAGCPTVDGQTWVIMVGDSLMYGSFNNFETLIQQSQFETRWYIDSLTNEYVYYSKITVDTTTVEYAWGVDTSTATGIKNMPAQNAMFSVYPNPANNVLNLDLSAFDNQPITIKVLNMIGQEVYAEKINATTGTKMIRTQNWAEGVYLVTIETAQQLYTQKVVREK